MKLKPLAAFSAVVLTACQTSNEADYTRIGYGPTFDVAHAQCEMRKGSVNQGYIAVGDPTFVAAAGLGNAIDNAVAQDQFMKNCLIIKGWKKNPAGAKSTPVAARAAVPGVPDVSPQYYTPGSWINGAILEQRASARQCEDGNKAACSRAAKLRRQIKSAGFEP